MKTIDDKDMNFKKRAFKVVPKFNGDDIEYHYSLKGNPVSLGKKLNYVAGEVQALKDDIANDFDKWLIPLLVKSAKAGEFVYILDYPTYCEHKFSPTLLEQWCIENELSVQTSEDSVGNFVQAYIFWGGKG